MKSIEVRTQKQGSSPKYTDGLNDAITFLGHSEDKITVKSVTEMLSIEVYENGKLLFSGDKYELFEILKGK